MSSRTKRERQDSAIKTPQSTLMVDGAPRTLYFARISWRRYKVYIAIDNKIRTCTLTVSAALGQFKEYVTAPNASESLNELVEQIRRAVFPDLPFLPYTELD